MLPEEHFYDTAYAPYRGRGKQTSETTWLSSQEPS